MSESPVAMERSIHKDFESSRKRMYEDSFPKSDVSSQPVKKRAVVDREARGVSNENFPPLRFSLPLRRSTLFVDSGCYGICQPVEASLLIE